jgi:N,N'-diacetyllegionaminate synthase
MRETGSIYKFGVRNFGFLNDGEDIGNGQLTNVKIKGLVNYFNGIDYNDVYEHWNKQDGDMGVANVWLYLNKDLLNKPGGKTMDDFLVELQDTQYFVQNPYVPYDENNKKIIRHYGGTSFHMDAEQMVSLLKSQCYQRNTGNLTHILANVKDIGLAVDGSIDYVIRDDSLEKIQADLYIDCTGFGRVLANRIGNTSWQDRSEYTNNSAWVCPSHYSDPHKEMICSTNIHGEDHGWRFQLNLYHRRGNGYVFNSNWVDPEVTLERIKQVTDGVEAQSAEIRLRNVKIVKDELSQGILIGTLINWSDQVDVITGISIGGSSATLSAPKFDLLKNKPIILSTGGSTLEDIDRAVNCILPFNKELAILQCSSCYPARPENINLNFIKVLLERYPNNIIGYSSHDNGIVISIGAYLLGARIIEKHFTTDRNLQGPDHKASLEPTELKNMVSSIRNIEKALGSNIKQPSQSELKNKYIVRKSLVAIQPIQTGEFFTKENIAPKRPGTGVSPMHWDRVIGQVANRSYAIDELIEI